MLTLHRSPVRTFTLAFLTSLLLTTACHDTHAKPSADSTVPAPVASADSTPATSPPAASAAPATSDNSASDAPTPADIDRWQKGMAAELEAVHKAGEQMHAAKTGNDTVNALFAANETSTRSAGASGAGLDVQRYQQISSSLSALAGVMAPLETSMDVSKMPPDAIATLKKSHDEDLARMSATLPPALVQAMAPRAAELHKQALALAAARLQVAGMSH